MPIQTLENIMTSVEYEELFRQECVMAEARVFDCKTYAPKPDRHMTQVRFTAGKLICMLSSTGRRHGVIRVKGRTPMPIGRLLRLKVEFLPDTEQHQEGISLLIEGIKARFELFMPTSDIYPMALEILNPPWRKYGGDT